MKCPECGSIRNSMNESIGETCCDECGLVLSYMPFEEHTYTVKKDVDFKAKTFMSKTNDGLGSNISPTDKVSHRLARTHRRQSDRYRGGLTTADKYFQIVCGNILYQYGFTLDNRTRRLKNECMNLRRRLQDKHKARGYSAELMAQVITYLVMKSQDISVSIRRHCTITGVDSKQLSKISKRWSKHMHNPQIHKVRSAHRMITESLSKLETRLEETLDDLFRQNAYLMGEYVQSSYDKLNRPYKNSTNAMCIWMASDLDNHGYRQEDIAACCETTAQTIRTQTRDFYGVFGLTKKKMKELTIEEIVNGIR